MKTGRTLVAALALLALGGCTRPGAALTRGGHNAWTVPGVIRLGEPDEPDSLNLLFAHTAAADEATAMLFTFLMRYDANGNYIPDLATQVPSYANGGISKDGKTITFHLRKGVVWADGAPLTASDWLFTYHAVLNPANDTKSLFGWDDIASARAPNPYTLVIHLKKVNASILGIFAMGGDAYPPLPAHLLAKLPNLNHASFNADPLSSGPYILKAWNHGSSLVFVPNPRYWRGPPHVKEVIWKVIPNATTLFTELQTHEIDVYSGVDELHIPDLKNISGIRVVRRLVANWRHLGFNLSRPGLRDVRVRRAIAAGVDWKRINDTVYHGYNQLAVSDIFPRSWAAPAIPLYRYDPQRAKQLLAQAGWQAGPNGILHKGSRRLSLELSTGTNSQENDQAEVQIQSDLRALGIKVRIRNYPVSLLFAQNGPLYSGKYDMEWTVETNAPDPDNSGIWNGAYIPPHGGNTSWLNDPIVNRASEEALTTFDRRRRKAYYQREEERIHQLVPAIFFYWENSYTAMNSDLRNYKPASFVADMWNCWQWRI